MSRRNFRKPRTNKQVVDDANALARLFYKSFGHEVQVGYRFDRATHPQEQGMWNLAAIAYEVIEGTTVEDAAIDVQEDEDRGVEPL